MFRIDEDVQDTWVISAHNGHDGDDERDGDERCGCNCGWCCLIGNCLHFACLTVDTCYFCALWKIWRCKTISTMMNWTSSTLGESSSGLWPSSKHGAHLMWKLKRNSWIKNFQTNENSYVASCFHQWRFHHCSRKSRKYAENTLWLQFKNKEAWLRARNLKLNFKLRLTIWAVQVVEQCNLVKKTLLNLACLDVFNCERNIKCRQSVATDQLQLKHNNLFLSSNSTSTWKLHECKT